MILNSVIRYTNSPVIEATWVDEEGKQVKCRAYDGSQMNELRADLGTNEHEALIAQCEADYIPPVVIPVIPSVVSMRQARMALHQTGKLAAVNAAVAAADEETKIAWEYSTEVQRNFPLVATLAAALSLTESDLDNLFTLAASL